MVNDKQNGITIEDVKEPSEKARPSSGEVKLKIDQNGSPTAEFVQTPSNQQGDGMNSNRDSLAGDSFKVTHGSKSSGLDAGGTGCHNAAEMEAYLRRQAEMEQRMREINEETTRSEDLRLFLMEMHEKRNQELLQQQEEMYDEQGQDGDMYQFAQELEPPDGGWGWLVVLGSFFSMIVIDGICFNYGLLIPDLQDTFKETKMFVILWPGSLLSGTYLLFGPMASALANQFDYRPVAMLGSFISSIGFVVSFFITNFGLFAACWGILCGLGFGLIYLPAIATVGHWFHGRRPLAVGLALCGSGVGTFVFGQCLPIFLEELMFRGVMFVFASFSLNCMVGAVLFRPLELHLRLKQINKERRQVAEAKRLKVLAEKKEQERIAEEQKKKKQAEKQRKKKQQSARKVVIHRGSIMQKIIEEKRRQRTTSLGSLDGMVITRDNELVNATEGQEIYLSSSAIQRIADSVTKKIESRRRSGSSLFRSGVSSSKVNKEIKNSMPQLVQDYIQSQVSLSQANQSVVQPVGSLAAPGRDFTVSSAIQPSSPNQSDQVSIDSNCESNRTPNNIDSYSINQVVIDDETKTDIQNQIRKEILRPMYKKDIFYGGSSAHLEQQSIVEGVGFGPELQRVNSMKSQSSLSYSLAGGPNNIQPPQMMNPGSPDEEQQYQAQPEAALSAFCNFIQEMLDTKILCSPTFLLLVLSSICAMLVFFIPFHFLPLYLIKMKAPNINLSEPGSLLSWVGISNTVGRLIATVYIERGWASQYPWADYFWINNVSLFLCGLSALLIPVLSYNYYLLLCVLCTYGVCIAAFVSLKSILVVELLGLEKLTNAFGYLLIFQGLAAIFGHPTAGFLIDLGVPYSSAFYFAGGFMILSFLLCLPLRHVAQWEQERWQSRIASQGYHYSPGVEDYDLDNQAVFSSSAPASTNQFNVSNVTAAATSPTTDDDEVLTQLVSFSSNKEDQGPPAAIPEEEEVSEKSSPSSVLHDGAAKGKDTIVEFQLGDSEISPQAL